MTTPTTATASGGAQVGAVARFALPRDPDVQVTGALVILSVLGLVAVGYVFR